MFEAQSLILQYKARVGAVETFHLRSSCLHDLSERSEKKNFAKKVVTVCGAQKVVLCL